VSRCLLLKVDKGRRAQARQPPSITCIQTSDMGSATFYFGINRWLWTAAGERRNTFVKKT
jgi:hypothetical protein